MTLSYPENTVWYVEASSADGQERTSGSAVAVWLQQIGKPETTRKYLLTCAHVLRGRVPGSKAGDSDAGYGPPLTDIRIWKPGNGFDRDGYWRAAIAMFCPFVSGIVPATERLAITDWAVLDVQNATFQGTDGNDVVRTWSIASHADLSIVGYAHGRARFSETGNIVAPFSKASFSLTTTQFGVLTYIGDGETREGMSGGGVFASDNSLRGLHRSKREPTRSGQAVSVSQIEAHLRRSGYERGEAGNITQPDLAALSTDPALATRFAPVVPKGLEAFGPEDEKFYPSLLPGAVRDGMPELISVWRRAVESFDPDETFRIGYVRGPSGCGKSSLVRAGLMPNLAPYVTAVYVDASDQDVELSLRRRLARELAKDKLTELASSVIAADDLSGALQLLLDDALSGRKFLLIVDQFEQWLHENRAESGDTELERALRRCDGTRLQALLLVRSEFVIGLDRLIDKLQVDRKREVMSRPFDRFDSEHSKSLLARFGAALNLLPFDLSQQEEFLGRAVQLLAEEDGRVVAVKLALFTEMLKGKQWTVDALPTGFQSLGEEFLRRQFSLPDGDAFLVRHRRGAMALMEALLPEYGRRIRGATRSEDELRAAFARHHASESFPTILDYLNSQLRLITPAEAIGEPTPSVPTSAPAGSNDVHRSRPPSASLAAAPAMQRFQLTHDYLVPSVREWLDDELGRTWDGRALVRLRDLARSWDTTQDDRFLPKTFEFVRIAAATIWRRHVRTPAEASLLRASTKRRGRGFLGAALLVVLTTVVGWYVLRQQPFWIRGQLSEWAVIITPNNKSDPGQGWQARADGYRDVETKKIGAGEFEERNLDRVGPLLAKLNDLTVIDFDDLPTLETVNLNGLRSLKELELSGCERLIDVELKNLPVLDTLALSGCFMLENLEGLAGLESLKTLDLSGCVKLKDPEQVLASLPSSVETLGLNMWDQFDKNMNQPVSMPTALAEKNIKHLMLARCKSISLNGLSQWRELEALDLSECGTIHQHAQLAECARLQTLVVKRIPADALGELALFGSSSVRRLTLSHGDFTTLEALPAWHQVAELDLTGCTKLKSLDGITELTGLKTLHLDECNSLADLGPLRGLTLEELTLRGCTILTDLAPLENVTTLKRLDLTDCNGVTSIEPLRNLRLEAIDMSGLSVWETEDRKRYLEALQASACSLTLQKLAWRGIMSTRDGDVPDGFRNTGMLSAGAFSIFKSLTAIDFGDREDDYTQDPPHIDRFEMLKGLPLLVEFNVYGFAEQQRREIESVLLRTRLSNERDRVSLARRERP